MGECFISRRGGGESYTLPVLNENYPQDVTVTASPSGTVSFSVQISEHGKPAEYTYQWCIDGSAISGATSSNYTRRAAASDVGTHAVYCNITNKAGTVTSRAATYVVKSAVPSGSASVFSGNGNLVKENDYNWRLYCYSSGTLTFDSPQVVDVFLVGGGGGGATGGSNIGGGGGGGYTRTVRGVSVTASTPNQITVGGGGAVGGTGGTSSAFGYSATGGGNGFGRQSWQGTSGGSGGSGGGGGGSTWQGPGGSDGSDGGVGWEGVTSGGIGQRTTTREFGEAGATLYSGGGGGCGSVNDGGASPGGAGGGGRGGFGYNYPGENGWSNTGGGGGGGSYAVTGGSGGSGIVVIRNAR